MAHESKTDAMTGAYHKTATKEMVDSYIAKHKDSAHMLLLIDVDDFKKVNDIEAEVILINEDLGF